MFKHCEVWRVKFGDKNKSHSSELFCVLNELELYDAINEYVNFRKKEDSIIDYDIVEIQGRGATPKLYIKGE